MNVRTRRVALHALGLALLLCSGCAAIGFEPLDDSTHSLPNAGEGSGSGGIGGSGGSVSGGQGGAGGQGGQGGSGGTRMDAGSGGTGGMIVPPTGGAGSMSDAGMPVITPCTGKEDFDDCDDGLYCTRDDICFAGSCTGSTRVCGDDCNVGTCDDDKDECVLTPRPDNTDCGFNNAFKCTNGMCSSPIIQCTEGGDCLPSCTNRECAIQCPNANSCDSTCANAALCNIDCQGTTDCKASCEDSECNTHCEDTGTCSLVCTGAAAACSVYCTDASGCDEIDCLEGATCVLACQEAEDCGFRACWAVEQQCDDGRVVCNATGDCN